MLYGVYVRPLLEHANPVVYSGRTEDVIFIECVQRAATKMVAGLNFMDYETRLAVLDLFPPEYRRLRGYLILTYALFGQGLANRFFTIDPANTRRGHGPRKVRTNRLATERLADPDARRTYQNRLLGSLPNAPPSDVNAYWDEIATSLHSAGNFAYGTAPPGALKHWISDRTVALLKSRRNIPAGPEHNLVRRIIRRQVKVSVKADREVWWTQKAKEMEEAQKSGNARRLFQLIRATGPRKPPVSETIKDRNGVTISNKEERLDRWAEYFEQQLSWPPAGAHLEPTGDVEPWAVNVEPPTASEVYDCICSLKRHRASGPDDLPPALLDFQGTFDSVLEQRLTAVSKGLLTQSGVRRGCPLSPFLFNFVIDEFMRRTLEGLQNPGIQIACDENLVNLEYADDIVLVLEEEEKAQVFLDELAKVIPSFVMHFAPKKRKIMPLDMQSLNMPLTIQKEVLEVMERFTYPGSCINSDCSVTNQESFVEVKPNPCDTSELHISQPDAPSPISPPTAPSSPLSPLFKEVLGNTRKRITVTLSTSPTAAGLDIAALLPSNDGTHQLLVESSCDSMAQIDVNSFDDPRRSPEVDLLESVFSPPSPVNDPSSPSMAVYVCPHCGQKYARLAGLEKHSLRSHGPASLTGGDGSPDCDRAPPNSRNCPRARPVSIDGPHFICNRCDRVFASKQACDLHARCHNGEKKFKCALCSVSFVQMNSLKRHTVAIHGIVPEPTYLDNADDKDFELTDDMNSDSDDSSTGKPHRTTHSRKRRASEFSHVLPVPRGRKKRPAGWLQTLGNCTVYVVDGSLFTVFNSQPRPSRSGVTDAPKPITISRPRRTRRTHRIDRSSLNRDNRSDILTPMLRDTLVRGSRLTETSDLTTISNQHPTVYVTSSTVLPNLVALEAQHGQYAVSYCDLDSVTRTEEASVNTKPAHVLTVAAAFVSQLPAGACPGSTTENHPTGSDADGNDEASTTAPATIYSLPSGVPSIQIYPSLWHQPEQLAGDTRTTQFTVTSQSDTSETLSLGSPEYIQSTAVLPANTTIAQQPVRLYPVLGPDGQTTLYYLATPVECLSNVLVDTVDQSNGSFTVSSPENYYTHYSHPTIAWVSDATPANLQPFQNTSTSSANSLTSSTDPGDSHRAALVTETSQNLDTTIEHAPENGTVACEDQALSTSDSPYVSRLVTSIFPGYTTSHTAIAELPETIEVIDLDASKFSSQFNEITVPVTVNSDSYHVDPCSVVYDNTGTELDTTTPVFSSTAPMNKAQANGSHDFCPVVAPSVPSLDHISCEAETQDTVVSALFPSKLVLSIYTNLDWVFPFTMVGGYGKINCMHLEGY
ncbi:zinc finger protein 341 [Clonorchis sinensis]|uniref:Zinc finger protein 341 n=1 Tax=Clonorchis sinensis TaxID=79923 RepID=G7YL50_CLOSI|nr:zinc finger protein 341 [Clonorchis sinensis]